MIAYIPSLFSQFLEGRITKAEALKLASFTSLMDRQWLESEIEKVEHERAAMDAEADERIDAGIELLEEACEAFETNPCDETESFVTSAAIAYAAACIAPRFKVAASCLADRAVAESMAPPHQQKADQEPLKS